MKGGFSFSRFSNNVFPFDKANKGDSYYGGFEQYARATFVPGVTADYQLSQRLTAGLELNYNGRGTVYRRYVEGSAFQDDYGETQKGYYYFKYRINSLELPMTLQYRLTNNQYGKAAVLLYGGIAPALNVRRKYSETDPNDPDIDVYSPANTGQNQPLANARKSNYSVLGGVKILTEEKPHGNFYIDVRFQYDALPTFTVDYLPNGYHNMGTYNWTGGLYLGYSF